MPRPETGPMEFEGDWCGVFIRGDSALMRHAMALRGVLFCIDNKIELPQHDIDGLRRLMGLLNSCDHHAAQNNPRLQRMKP